MASLRDIDIRKINANGRYVDLNNNTILDLTDEQIVSLRRYYNDSSIAINRIPQQIQEFSRRDIPRRQEERPRGRTQYRVTREQKYNDGRHRTKKKPKNNIGKFVIVGSLVVCVALGGRALSQGESLEYSDTETTLTSVASNVESSPTPSSFDEQGNGDLTSIVESIVSDGYDLDYAASNPVNRVEEVEEDLSERQIMIQDICNIYQVNYDKVYPCLVQLTDNFSNENYLNGVISGVTCKGVQVQASSEEELLVYAIRCIKQLPENLGVTVDNLYVNNGYVSGNNYNEQISRVAEILGVDRCFLYAIVQSECGFDSDLFNNKNNPAGIKAPDGSWWVFDTKEEGFFELGMEVLKYYRKIGVTPDHIDYDTIASIRDIHAPLSDGNQHWLPNVTSNLEYAKLHEAEMFGDLEQNNGLSR